MNLKAIIISLSVLITSFPVFADEIYQENAVAVCSELKQKNYSKKCLAMIKKVQFNDDALEYCASQGSWNKIKTCLSLIKDSKFEAAPLAICTSSKQFTSALKKCVQDVANKTYVSKIEVGLCAQEKSYNLKTKCLKGAASKPYVEAEAVKVASTDVALAALQVKIKAAYELLRKNQTADATIMLHDLVSEFDKK